MIVELIGCAGAGKTTLRRMLCERGVGAQRVMAMADVLLDRPGLRRITHPTAINLYSELVGFPAFLRAHRRDPSFARYAGRLCARDVVSRYEQLVGMRGVVRKLAMHELATTRARDAVVLCDEGLLLCAYNLFVMTGRGFDLADVERFASVVPPADVVVHVRAPVEALVERARSRPDPRRQHVGRTDAAVEQDMRRTAHLFDLLAATPPLAGRVIVADNADGGTAAQRRLADDVADRLRHLDPAGSSDAATPTVATAARC